MGDEVHHRKHQQVQQQQVPEIPIKQDGVETIAGGLENNKGRKKWCLQRWKHGWTLNSFWPLCWLVCVWTCCPENDLTFDPGLSLKERVFFL